MHCGHIIHNIDVLHVHAHTSKQSWPTRCLSIPTTRCPTKQVWSQHATPQSRPNKYYSPLVPNKRQTTSPVHLHQPERIYLCDLIDPNLHMRTWLEDRRWPGKMSDVWSHTALEAEDVPHLLETAYTGDGRGRRLVTWWFFHIGPRSIDA